MVIDDNKVVSLHYTLKDDKGNLLDESSGEPLQYLQGHGQIIDGLEKALSGLGVGDKKSVTVKPEEGYGVYDERLKITVDRKQFGKQLPPQGAMVQLKADNGQMLSAQVVSVTDKQVQLDGNHPLAGKTLHFDVHVAAIREASPEEIQHGHPHGPEGHHHHH